MAQSFEYKVVLYKEPLLGSILLGQSMVSAERMTRILNEYAAEGWRIRTMERYFHRTLLFFKRESFILTFERELTPQISKRLDF